ncbi:MAG: hypothetical protein L3J67_07015 [Hyphomicrobiaceae bacterium]|nr:hypothetical protein [Hyphomicrobiaceae bacterium]
MLYILLGILVISIGIFLSMKPDIGGKELAGLPNFLSSKLLGGLLILAGLVSFALTSFVLIDSRSVGHLKRIYAWNELPEGRIIALDGQKGPQARVLGPGFHFMPFVRVLYSVEQLPVITIPDGSYGAITALDGKTMPEGMFIAPAIPDDKMNEVLKAKNFITQGWYRGPQESVLKPGQYRLNKYLFKVTTNTDLTKATIIPAGHVGVVKSNVKKPGAHCVKEKVSAAKSHGIEGALTVPLVPRGCIGIWKEPLFPGAYYLNRRAYQITLVDTRVRTWEYKGGFTKRIIDLSVDQQGNIKQQERTELHEVPRGAADRAVFVKIEGWDIPLELRALVQIQPENAPVVVGSVGGIDEVEDRILTPAIRSIVRNVAGSNISVPLKNEDGTLVTPLTYKKRPTRVLDLIDNRAALERTIEDQIKIEGRKAGVEIKEIRLGEPSIPPELLISRLRVQLADQLSNAYERETQAQQKRVETEKARSTANKQPQLVSAQIAVQVANQREKERAALGRAERQFLEELARGQMAQANVLGKDRVAMLQALEKLLATLEKKPELVGLISRLVPHTVVGDGGGLAGAAAILGNAFNSTGKNTKP